MIRQRLLTTLVPCIAALALAVAALFTSVGASAETIIDVPAAVHMVDLSVHGAIVEADRRNVAVELPETAVSRKAILDLQAKGPGPKFSWTVYTIHNASPAARDFVIAVDPQRLAASGLFPLRPFGRRAIQLNAAGDTRVTEAQSLTELRAFNIRIEGGASASVAVEAPLPLLGVRLYDEAAFNTRETAVAFLRGAALTVTLVITLLIVGLYSVRSHRAFVAGSFLAFACLLFMAVESGVLDRFGNIDLGPTFSVQTIRAWSEALFSIAIGLAAWALPAPHALKRRSRWWVAVLLVLFAALLAHGYFNPDKAAAAARVLSVFFTAAGFLLCLDARQKQAGALDLGMVLWSSIAAWVFFAVIAALGPYEAPVFHAGILAGLATVVAILAFALARLALAQGYMSNPYLTGAASRSLALAGGHHVLWDWRPVTGQLYLGKELAELLGLDPYHFSGPDAARLFQALLHPADVLSYQKCAGIHAASPGDAIEGDFRLQASDGTYAWFALRATALPGPSNWPERAIGTLTDITDLKDSESKLIQEAMQDPVTSLPSRAIFNDRLERELAKPLGLPVKVLLVGLTRFKTFNDGLGHDLGDQMLLAAGQRIAECLKQDETLARISGSIFAVMYVEAIDKRNADRLAVEIIQRLAEPMPVAGQDVHLSACIGISQSSSRGMTATALHDQAARALAEAQARGLAIHLNFEESMKNERAAAVAMEGDLRRALARGEIEVHYQPIVHLGSRGIVGFEALARWQHAEKGYLPPADFITVAEQAGLVGDICNAIMPEAARQLGIWQRTLARDRHLFVAVNVSGEQISDTTLFDRIAGIVEREGLLADSLKIEITESVAMRFPERARQLISRLKGAAVSVACDDFGTGFSNLALLRDLQFDTLKMDRSFIADGGIEGRGGIILGSVISLAHQLGMSVVAEGIEDEQMALLLEAVGADMGQGYWLGQPMPARDVPEILAVFPAVETLPPLPVETQAEVTADKPMFAPLPGTAPMAPRVSASASTDDDAGEGGDGPSADAEAEIMPGPVMLEEGDAAGEPAPAEPPKAAKRRSRRKPKAKPSAEKPVKRKRRSGVTSDA